MLGLDGRRQFRASCGGYLAPEQARGAMLTPAADVWGIGITLYEAATGDAPFDHGTTSDENGDAAQAADHTSHEDRDDDHAETHRYPQLHARAPSVATRRRLPRSLAAAIDSCLTPAPDSRPTLTHLAAALELPQGRREVTAEP
ncbi:protein kinase [Streptomyces sp. NPDC058000]|uniref:protein kinase domain-containing protein n=1 Tax=Streptomyces sp. NPDC058000 TaxID=3346299 RepID=UPI0036EDFC10